MISSSQVRVFPGWRSIFAIPLLFVISAFAFSENEDQVFGFGLTDSGGWIGVRPDQLDAYQDSSRVVCRRGGAVIEVAQNAESGDWAAADRYSSDGPFFTRTIRFAQFPDVIRVIKRTPESRPRMQAGGADVAEYQFLLESLATWTRIDDVPFPLPDCASVVFRR